MITFEEKVVINTVSRLLEGKDYRKEIVSTINVAFLDFTLEFFKKIVMAKYYGKDINMDWYESNFISSKELNAAEAAINAGINKKTVSNIYGSAKKEILLDVAIENYSYLQNMLSELEKDSTNDLDISIKISYNKISVELSLTESLIVINALATKKLQIRGGAWSSIGKRVEKPLLDKLCELVGVPLENKNNETFVKDPSKEVDREIDYKLYSSEHKEYKVEVKLMGKGNPESADAIIARNSDIFVADTMSEQNKNQCRLLNIEYLELKDNDDVIGDFKKILDRLDIPYTKQNLS